jgi:eukaryotic translation initiation factor 2C
MLYNQVSLAYEDGRPVDGKGVGRKVIDRVHETYDTEFGKDFAYDGEKSLFTVGPLPRNKLEFTVVLEDVVSNRFVNILLMYSGCCCCFV